MVDFSFRTRQKLYIVVGDVNGEGNLGYMVLAQNIEDSKVPDGRGGILRLTVDRTPGMDNDSFSLGDSGLLNFYYGWNKK